MQLFDPRLDKLSNLKESCSGKLCLYNSIVVQTPMNSQIYTATIYAIK